MQENVESKVCRIENIYSSYNKKLAIWIFSSVCVKTLARIYFIIVEFSPPYALPKRQ